MKYVHLDLDQRSEWHALYGVTSCTYLTSIFGICVPIMFNPGFRNLTPVQSALFYVIISAESIDPTQPS